jgi:hypothetical protein
MENIRTLSEVLEALQLLGYEASLGANSVAVKVGGLNKPFNAVITHCVPSAHFQVTCPIAKLGEIPEAKIAAFAIGALDANNRIAPYAYALISSNDDPTLEDEAQWPIVLIDTLPIGDLSVQELGSSLRSLVAALVDSRDVLQAFELNL